MFGYRRFTKRRLCVYFAFLPILVVYLIGLSLKRNTVKYFQKHSQVRTFRDNESYLEQDAFFRKIRNNSYETCAAIFEDTSNLLSHKLHHNNFLDDPMAIPWSGEQEENALLFRTEILNILQGALLQGNSGDFPDQQRFYFEIAQMKFVRTVCETGFNAGHSAFIWLNSKENVQLYSFDIGEHNYTQPAVQLLQSMFPGRLHIKYGDSRWTLPEFHRLHPDVSCDLIVIDGGHYQNVPRKDLINFRKMASQTNLIILDDKPGPGYFENSIDDMWKEMLSIGFVKELFTCISDKKIATLDRDKGLTLGKYI